MKINLSKVNLITPGVFMSFPLLMATIWQGAGSLPATENSALKAFEAQGWVIAVIASAMGLVRIALWLRGYKEGSSSNNDIVNKDLLNTLTEIIKNQTVTLTKLIDNDQLLSASQLRLSDNQQRLVDSQNRALDNHAKILESLTIFRLNQENHEEDLKVLRGIIDKNTSLLEKLSMRKFES